MIDDEEKRLRDEAIENMNKANEVAQNGPGLLDCFISFGSSISPENTKKAKVEDIKVDMKAANDLAASATVAAKDAIGGMAL